MPIRETLQGPQLMENLVNPNCGYEKYDRKLRNAKVRRARDFSSPSTIGTTLGTEPLAPRGKVTYEQLGIGVGTACRALRNPSKTPC
jgi:hypothetical protein